MRWVIIILLSLGAWIQGTAQDTRWIAHYTREGGGFATFIELVNTDFEAVNQIQLTPHAANGLVLEDHRRALEIAPGQRLTQSLEDLGWQGLQVSHIGVEGPSQVSVATTFLNTAEGAMPAVVEAGDQLFSGIRFLPVTGSRWFDGVVAVNPHEESASLTVTAHDRAGNTLATTAITVPARAKWLDVTNNLFEGLQTVEGYYEIRSDRPLVFMGLRGSLGAASPAVLTELQLSPVAVPQAKLTYANQIGRIFNRTCAQCHHEEGIAPFPLTHYDEVDNFRDFIAFSVSNGDMPPWKAGDNCEEFKDSQAMDPTERAMMLQWLADGAPEGDPQRAPEVPVYENAEWTLGEPDFIAIYPEAFDFDGGDDAYRCFPIEVGNDLPVQLSALEVQVGNPAIVHHVLVFLSQNQRGQELDMAEAGPGYTCFGGPETGDIQVLTGWAPGGQPQIFEDDLTMTLEPGTTLIVQVHYHFSTTEGLDQTRIGLHFSEEKREKELFLLPMANQDFLIPPGAKNHPVEFSITLPPFISADIYSIFPHMHLLGKTISLEHTLADGSQTCLIDIPRWDFDWQRFYDLKNPVRISGGDTITLRCTYDNSEENPHNPFSPPIPITWGEATTDEMALAFIGVVAQGIGFGKESGDGAWQWPVQLGGGKKKAPLPEGVKVKTRLPSCCQPGAVKKPWKSCPSKTPLPETARK